MLQYTTTTPHKLQALFSKIARNFPQPLWRLTNAIEIPYDKENDSERTAAHETYPCHAAGPRAAAPVRLLRRAGADAARSGAAGGNGGNAPRPRRAGRCGIRASTAAVLAGQRKRLFRLVLPARLHPRQRRPHLSAGASGRLCRLRHAGRGERRSRAGGRPVGAGRNDALSCLHRRHDHRRPSGRADLRRREAGADGPRRLSDHARPLHAHFLVFAGRKSGAGADALFAGRRRGPLFPADGKGRRHGNFGGRAIHGRLPRARRAVRGDAGLRSAAGHPSGGPCRHGGGRRGAAGCMVQRRRGRDHRSAGG